MYNILVFGLTDLFADMKQEFKSLSCKFLHINSGIDFYSIAFSRVFDLWILDGSHKDFQELVVEELIAPRAVPHIIVLGGSGNQSVNWSDKAAFFKKNEYSQSVPLFMQLMHNKKEQNREKYLAGFVQKHPDLDTIVTKSPLMEQLIDLVKDVAPTESPILLVGETGTGKELLANVFHNESRRRSGPFMAVNCGALPDTLLESELFGYEKGAFTGASGRRIGKIEHATGGTLFLDEVEAMSAAMQNRLLRVLQERTLQRLGSNTDINTDFRVIAATNTDPVELVGSGILRSDLYYRLSVFQVKIPPLRDRTEDIPILVQHFVNKKKRNGREYVRGLDNQAMNILLSAPWFGNVRELQNVIERAVMLASSSTITADLIQTQGISAADSSLAVAGLPDNAFRPGITLKSYKNLLSQSAERKYLVELLDYTCGRIGEAAQLAGLTPRALYNKMKIHGLKKEDFKKSEDFR
ncbi:sigma-54 interaction domain-containing protein [Desulforhopalus singaporensis]|uniref:DNA-binding transcriptional response regulator, NtrC family, contains REC, AAA-type ATPase, and a Fis-type DNA-binding domains n=1 Tax=Desulforhopalus singaporensis TaxID=91360 RepID=A0A1H0UHI1_9BACT|nr:sigma-54 dependent transcriptional regulator [Desulforhopalus singaporensis]SDP65601.1 DNA-binding transcriptional response regulator, NtrC family, contains REC, AAA-type ATPase, and a Fis-type DNA-binding domains [Desulforhopalus singaporensis]